MVNPRELGNTGIKINPLGRGCMEYVVEINESMYIILILSLC